MNLEEENAYSITDSTSFVYNDEKGEKISLAKLKDENYKTYTKFNADSIIEISNNIPIKSLYILYEFKGYQGKLTFNNKSIEIGKNNFIHEYIELPEETNNVKLQYSEDTIIADIYTFSKGKKPDYIQSWKANTVETDLLLFSTHSDDEHLMFAGVLPTYVSRNYNVQVAYMTNHGNNNSSRFHELLNGLWVAGVTNYPEIGPFPDQHSRGYQEAINNLEKINLEPADIMNWQVETIRKYRPSVVVGHAENGEYGHGQHRLNSKCLEKAVEESGNPKYKTSKYKNIWEVKKTYIHLYEHNQIIIDIDVPLEYFNGLTAFQISQLAFKEHKSQMSGGWVYKWLCGPNGTEITSSSQLTKYFPNRYGLYKSIVGNDKSKNDFFENLD